MTTATTGAPKQRSWPKVHLIYFLLAAFDIAAIAGGLYLSHQYGLVFKSSVQESEAWDRRTELVLRLAELSGQLGQPANNVFASRDSAQERSKYIYLSQGFEQLQAEFLIDAMSNAPLDRVRPVFLALNDVPAQLAQVSYETRQVMNLFESGDFEGAATMVTTMNGTTEALRQNMYVAAVEIQKVRAEMNRNFGGMINDYRGYEYVIGGAIVFIVMMVSLYGYWVGRLMKRKHFELLDAHATATASEAEARDMAGKLMVMNEDIGSLNIELKENLTKLAEAQDELVRKGRLSQLGQLTATVAHELRNPMGAVRTSAFVLERKLKGKGLGVEQQIERINNGVNRCDSIITQLLDFARTKSMQCEARDFDTWLVKVVEEEAEKLPASVAVEVRLGLNGESVEFDQARLSRVLINLLSNASEAMVGKGDAPEKPMSQSPWIIVETKLTARGAEFSVTDNGPGISEENLKRILEPLFTTKNFGTGLGLPAVEKILEQHGGGLDIKSKLGEGARFTGWLPLKQRQAEAA